MLQSNRFRPLAFVLCAVLSMGSLAWGQVTTGSILGTITDNSRALIPGAVVVAVSQATGGETRTEANAAGAYELLLLRAGAYRLIVEAPGFQKLVREGVIVRTTEAVRVNLTLQLGQVTETVTVTAETPLLQSEQATLGHVVEGNTITSIPLATRNFTQILGTSAGVVNSILNADQVGIGTDNPSVNGARRGSNNLLVDGAPVTNPLNNAPEGTGAPSIEFLNEFKVLTSLYSAEYGRNAGSIINVTTRSGTNAMHGVAYEFLRNTRLNAKPFFRTEKPQNVQNQFGANAGGPIVRDRTFFFAGWETSRQRNAGGSGAFYRARIPTKDQREGRFGVTLWDPLNNAQFPNNTIPESRIDAISKKMQETFIPLPNFVDPASGMNFLATQSQTADLDEFTARIDHRFSNKDSTGVRYFQSLLSSKSPFSQGPPPAFGNFSENNKHDWSVTHTHLFSPTFILEARASGDYTYAPDRRENTTDPRTLGLKPIEGVTAAGPGLGPPRVNISNYLNFGNDSGFADDIDRYTYGGTFTVVRPRHTLKFGGENQTAFMHTESLRQSRGIWSFAGLGTGQRGARGDEYADFLLTLPRTTQFAASDSAKGAVQQMTSSFLGFFVNDDWKVRSNLTVSAGLRYEADFQAGSTIMREANFWPDRYKGLDGTLESTGIVQDGLKGVPKSTVDGDWNNLMPRLGIAWRVTDKWVLRTGAGLYFDLRTGQIRQQLKNNPPNLTTFDSDCTRPAQSCSVSVPDRFTYQNPGHKTGYVPFPTDLNQTMAFFAIERKAKSDNAWQYNLALQRQLPGNMIFETAYVGTKGSHLVARRNINPLIPAAGYNAPLFDGVRLVRLYPGFGDISTTAQNGNSSYHSLQATLKRRVARSTFQLAYTFSKTLGNGSEDSRYLTEIFATPWNDFSRAKGPALFDRTHRLSFVFGHELPNVFQNAIGKAVLNDWSMNGFLVAQTGTPLTVTNRDSGRNIGGAAGSTTASNLFADVRSDVPLPMGDVNGQATFNNLDHYINPAAFSRARVGAFGNSGRGMFRGPGQWNLDFSMFKNIPMTERFKLQFRSEFYNLFNHTNFVNPTTTMDSTAYGTIRDTSVNARLIQFALKLTF